MTRFRDARPGRLVLSAAAAVLVLTPAGADVVVIEPVKDNTLFTNGNSNGAGDSVFSGQTGGFGNFTGVRAVLAFDVAGSVPAGAEIISASLSLELLQASFQGGPSLHTLHRILADWGEAGSAGVGGQGDIPQPGDATWTHTFFPDQFWLNAGGDFVAAVSSSQNVATILGRYEFGTTPAMVNDVQGWLDAPATSYGWLIMGDEATPNSAKRFGSRENNSPAARPLLTIEYELPCPWDCGDGNGVVDTIDFLALLGEWGMVGTGCDFGGDGVDTVDFLKLLANWGPCS